MNPLRITLCSLTLAILGALAAPACAQTLTVEIEGGDGLVLDAEVEGVRGALTLESSEAPPLRGDAGPAPVIVVRPPEDALAPPARAAYAPATPVTPVRVPGGWEPARPVEPSPLREHAEFEASAEIGVFVDGMNLAPIGLSFGRPEVGVLRGVTLDEQWAGIDALRDVVIGGLNLGFGMRASGYFRGPQFQFSVGGGDLDGEWAAAPGVEGFEFAVQRVTVLRASVSAGVQLPLGPFTPYALARASIGGAFVDVAVREERLGELGTETVDALVPEVGMEIGLDVALEEGVDFGMGYRGGWLGVESHGAFLHLSFHGE